MKQKGQIRSFIRTHRFTLTASHHPNKLVALFAKDARWVAGLLFPISNYALDERKGGSFL